MKRRLIGLFWPAVLILTVGCTDTELFVRPEHYRIEAARDGYGYLVIKPDKRPLEECATGIQVRFRTRNNAMMAIYMVTLKMKLMHVWAFHDPINDAHAACIDIETPEDGGR